MPAVRQLTVALVGNPNTGKTTLFNALSGLRQRVGNYPGVTVEMKKGKTSHNGRTLDVVDLPGTYSLAPRSPDEMVAVDLLLGQQPGEPRPDVVVAIVDASNLERNLYLTTQVMELGEPVVVALNMVDVAESQGIQIDCARLTKQLGISVVPIQANKGKGIDSLKQAILQAAEAAAPAHGPAFPPAFEKEVAALQAVLNGSELPLFLVRRLLLDVAGHTERRLTAKHGPAIQSQLTDARTRLAEAQCPVPLVEARTRYAWIREATAGCLRRPTQRPVAWTDRIDRVLTHPVWGTLIFLSVMFLVFQSIFTGAQPLMQVINAGKNLLAGFLTDTLPAGPLTSLLADGVVKGVGSVLVFLPQIMILFAFIAVLEDCGYMARAAFLMDKVMARAGLSGKSFIPLLSSVACAIPGIMATRVIENPRDRLTTILVAPLMSCSARLPVYTLLIAAFLTTGYPFWLPGLVMFAMYSLGLVLAPLVALVLKRTLLRGETPVFVMEMPVYKWPSLRAVVRRMLDSGWAFIRRAGTLILASMVVVWALLYFPRGESPAQRDAFLQQLEEDLTARRAAGASQPQVAEVEARIDQTRKHGLTFDEHHSWLAEQKAWLEEQAQQAAGEDRQKYEQAAADKKAEMNRVYGDWKRSSFLGQMGQAIEPVVAPLGWDWKIGMAALASFPAREVVVATLGIIYNLGEDEVSLEDLGKGLTEATWKDEPGGRPVFTVPVALSLMVFFALCCQCASTLAVIRRETRSWFWPAFTFVYMTVLAYAGAFITYQAGSLIERLL